MNRPWGLKWPLNHCQAKAAQVGLRLGGTDGVWPQKEECRREGLSMAWSVASFSSWKKTALCKIERGNIQSQ